MAITATLTVPNPVQGWLARAPCLALILAIAACGPLVSLELAQQTALDHQTLSDTQGSGFPKFVGGAVLAMAGFFAAAIGGGLLIEVITGTQAASSTAALIIGVPLFIGGLACLGLAVWLVVLSLRK